MYKKKELSDFHERWIKLTNKMEEQGEHTLTPPEKVWVMIQSFLGICGNGGIISFYYNPWWGTDDVHNLLTSLDTLGGKHAIELKNIIQKVNTFFPNSVVPKEIDERNEIIDSWGEKEFLFLEKFNAAFFAIDDNLAKDLATYLEAHGF